MKCLKITLLLVLASAFVLCDNNYGQYPLVQSRGLDILSLKRNDNSLSSALNTRNTIPNKLRSDESRMNLRGNLDSNPLEGPQQGVHTHVWRPQAPTTEEPASRTRNQLDASDSNPQEGPQQGVHTHVWRPQEYYINNEQSRARSLRNTPQESQPVPAEHYSDVHTHQWRGSAPVNDLDHSNNNQQSRSRSVQDAEEDELINRGEDARLQDIQNQAASGNTRGVHTHVWRDQSYYFDQSNKRNPQANYRRNVVNDVVRSEEQSQASQSQSVNARTVDDEEDDDDIVARAEEARLQDIQQDLASSNTRGVHTHVWRDQSYYFDQAKKRSIRANKPAEPTEDEIINHGEDERLKDIQGYTSRGVRDAGDLVGPQPGVHTHVWKPQEYYLSNQQSRSRSLRNAPQEEQDQVNDVHTHQWRGSAPVNDLEDADQQRSRNVRTVGDASNVEEPQQGVHTHQWRGSVPTNDLEQSNTAVARNIRTAERPSDVNTHIWRPQQYYMSNQARSRSLRNAPQEEQAIPAEHYSDVHTHQWRGSVPTNDLEQGNHQRGIMEEDASEERLKHGQHFPENSFIGNESTEERNAMTIN